MSGKVEGKKGTGTSFFLIYRRTFLALATMGVTSYHWTLQDTVFIGRKKAWVIPQEGDPASVHGFWARLTVPKKEKSSWGLVMGWEISDNLHTHNWEVKEDPTTTKYPRCQNYYTTFRVF